MDTQYIFTYVKITPHKPKNNDHFLKGKSGRFAVCICIKCKKIVMLC